MTRIRCALALLISSTLVADATAQFIPVIGLPAMGQGGVAFQLGGRSVRVSGFVPFGDPYAAIVPVTPTPYGFKQVAPAFLPSGYGYGLAAGFPFAGYGAIDQRI